MITKFHEVSGKTLVTDDHSLWYHILDGTFHRTKWLAAEHGFNKGLTFKEILSKLQVNYNKSNEFEKYDWTQEPSKSWEELMKDHALYFRDKYDYLSILYSGGQDSQYILNIFLEISLSIAIDDAITPEWVYGILKLSNML